MLARIDMDQDGERLDRALAKIFPQFSRSYLAKLIDDGRVEIDGARAEKSSQRVNAGQKIAIDVPPPAPAELVSQDLPIKILYEDAGIVVVDKPAGLVVHPAAGHADSTLVNALLFHIKNLSGVGGELRPGIVHRLDKDTSGVMVIAKNDAAHRALSEQWRNAKKEYLAIVYGSPKNARGTIDAPIGRDPRNRKRMAVITSPLTRRFAATSPRGEVGSAEPNRVRGARNAITDYEVVEELRYVSLLRCAL
ncbi:MAG TPA: RluA family pseudouridine synthase, partial [Thermoanaerobaculia bacterium]|nr:RluA family pseudouridine synthase [Thermoanaerobaculia bacterium]